MSRAWMVIGMGVISVWVGNVWSRPVLPPFQKTVSPRFAPQDSGAVLVGARKVGASLAFIQTLQYYGGPVPPGEEGLSSPRLFEYGRRMLSLNPYYRYGVMYVAGVLAFNNFTNRPDEALALIAQAAKKDPTYWNYQKFTAAIGYAKDHQTEESVPFLEESINNPECPSMIKHILANIHRKSGRYARAAEIYLSLVNARDPDYSEQAKKNLHEIIAQGQWAPEVIQ